MKTIVLGIASCLALIACAQGSDDRSSDGQGNADSVVWSIEHTSTPYRAVETVIDGNPDYRREFEYVDDTTYRYFETFGDGDVREWRMVSGVGYEFLYGTWSKANIDYLSDGHLSQFPTSLMQRLGLDAFPSDLSDIEHEEVEKIEAEYKKRIMADARSYMTSLGVKPCDVGKCEVYRQEFTPAQVNEPGHIDFFVDPNTGRIQKHEKLLQASNLTGENLPERQFLAEYFYGDGISVTAPDQ